MPTWTGLWDCGGRKVRVLSHHYASPINDFSIDGLLRHWNRTPGKRAMELG